MADSFVPDSFVADSKSNDSFVPDSFVADSKSNDSFVPDSFVADSKSNDSFVPDSFVADSKSNDSFVPDSFAPDKVDDSFIPDVIPFNKERKALSSLTDFSIGPKDSFVPAVNSAIEPIKKTYDAISGGIVNAALPQPKTISPFSKTELRAPTEQDIISQKNLTPAQRSQQANINLDVQLSHLADNIATVGFDTPDQALKVKQKQDFIIGRAPMIAMAMGAPLAMGAFEGIQQFKNMAIAHKLNENYTPLASRTLSELLPANTDPTIKVGMSVAEMLGDIAIVGTAANLASKGLLNKTIDTVTSKISEKYGIEQGQQFKTVMNAAIENGNLKASTPETEIARLAKSKNINFNDRLPFQDNPAPQQPITPKSQAIENQSLTAQPTTTQTPEIKQPHTIIAKEIQPDGTTIPIIRMTPNEPLSAPVAQQPVVSEPQVPGEVPATPKKSFEEDWKDFVNEPTSTDSFVPDTTDITGFRIKEFAKNNATKILSTYESKYGNYVSNDRMKDFFKSVGYNGLDSTPYQTEAGHLTKSIFDNLIEKNRNTGKEVLLMTGGTGSGKTTSINKIPNKERFSAIWDLNLVNPEKNSEIIQQVIDAGQKPKIIYVLRNPEQAFIDGVMKRGSDTKSIDYNRAIKLDEHILVHNKARETFLNLVNKFENKIDYEIWDNRGKENEKVPVPIDTLKNIKYDYNALKEDIKNEIQNNHTTSQQFKDKLLERIADRAGERKLIGKQVEGKTRPEDVSGQNISEVRTPTELNTSPNSPALNISQYPITEVPLNSISLSKDVPNFKKGAMANGVVEGEQLGGKYNRLGTPPVVLWERNNGKIEIITGRHRLDLAKRNNEKTIPAQIVKEANGFSKGMAQTFDAESNILDEKGSVEDYAKYFRIGSVEEKAARDRGLLARHKGNVGFRIGTSSSDALWASYINGKTSDQKTYAIANGAPNNETAQVAALKKAPALSATELETYTKILNESKPSIANQEQGGLFGFDDTALKEAEDIARNVALEVKDLRDKLLSVKSPLTRPKVAREMGIDFKDEVALRKEVSKIQSRIDRLGKIATDKELYNQFRSKTSSSIVSDNGATEYVSNSRKSTDLFEAPLAIKYKKQGSFAFRNQTISDPADVAFAFKTLKDEAVEKFYVVGIKNNLPVFIEYVSSGTVNSSLVHPREVFGLLVKNKADGVYFVHNHPSGEVTPSSEDKDLTRSLSGVAKELGIDYKGHIIIDTNKFGFLDKNLKFEALTHHAESTNSKNVSIYTKYAQWSAEKPTDFAISHPEHIYEVIKGLSLDAKKNALVLHLNGRNNVLMAQAISKAPIDYNSIFRQVMKLQTNSIVLVNSGLDQSAMKALSRKFENSFQVKILDMIESGPGGSSYKSAVAEGIISEGSVDYGLNDVSKKIRQRPLPELPKDSEGYGVGKAPSPESDNSLQQNLSDVNTKINESIIDGIKKSPTPLSKKINLIDYLRTPENVLKKIGLEKEGDALRAGFDAYLKELPKNINEITNWANRVPGQESNQKIFQYLDGNKLVVLNPEEQKVAGEIKAKLAEWADRLNLPLEKRISNYITHIFDDQLLKKEFDEDLAKIISNTIAKSVYDPFLLQRYGIQGYKQDTWAALQAYIKRATRKVNIDPALEKLSEVVPNLEKSQLDYIKKYIDRINMRPTDIDNLIDNGLKQLSFVGYKFGQRPTASITRFLRQMTYRAKLGLNVSSALRNLSQGINTYAKLGEKYTFIGYLKLFNPANHVELKEQGILNSGFVEDKKLNAIKKSLEKIDKGLFLFFETAERINRGSAYFGAKAKALSQGHPEEYAIAYAKKIARNTQFLFSAIDTPIFLQSDIMKTLTQFQTYNIKQIEFLTDMAKNKEWLGLVRYVIAGLAFVFTIGKIFGMAKDDILPAINIGIPPSLLVLESGRKAILGTPDKYGHIPNASERISSVVQEILGSLPASTQIKKTIQGIEAVNRGGVFTSNGRLKFRLKDDPITNAQAILFGKYASESAQEYFAKRNHHKVKHSNKGGFASLLREAGKFIP